MATRKLRAAVVGYGGAFNMGKWHLNEMKRAGMTPVAVCDLDESRLAIAAAEFAGVATYTSVPKMLRESDCDIVTLITPHNTHAKLATQCLKAGKHVVVEKPMAITTAECDSMIAAAGAGRGKSLTLSTYHNRHWDGCILHAMKKISSGAIGKVVRIEAHMGSWGHPGDWWRSSRSISGGVLYDWGVHLLEYTLQLMQAPIAEVTGFAVHGVWADKTPWKKDTNEDEGFILVRYADGRWSSLLISRIDSAPREGVLTITGTQGTYILDMRTWKMVQSKGGTTVTTEGANPPSQSHRYYQNVARHITAKEKLVITPEWARRPIHIIDLACRSARAGKALKATYA